MRKIIAIPARLASSRLPNKLLLPYKGKPILRHVIENALGSLADLIIVMSEDQECLDITRNLSANCYALKTDTFNNGTEKVISNLHQLNFSPSDLVINLQADIPLFDYKLIDKLFAAFIEDMDYCEGLRPIVTMARKVQSKTENGSYTSNKNRVKVVTDRHNNALYFSRSHIPYNSPEYLEHIGVYGFSYNFIHNYQRKLPSNNYPSENLEQLNWMHDGFKVYVKEVSYNGISIDTKCDYDELCQRST
jgi:3-deoxy-manno-octulosonate cytidylyltransferase (CMP-KDO synthetase)